MNKRKNIRILIADDHFVVAEGISSILGTEADMNVVNIARNGEEAVAHFDQKRPDVLVLDLRIE